MEHDVFLSYKTEDRQKAEIIAKALEQRGFSVWWDQKIPPGWEYPDFIEQSIGNSRCVVVLWSESSIFARWVNLEAAEGLRRGALIPILIDRVESPFQFRLIEAARLIGWMGELPN